MSTKASIPGYCMMAIWSHGPVLADQDLDHVVVEREDAPSPHDLVQRHRRVAAVGLGTAEAG